jgi:mannitol-1-phosphate 5-dehydrogenase
LEKLSTINLAQAVASYLGHLVGCRYVHEAVIHPTIAPVVRGASTEAVVAFKTEFPNLSTTIESDAQEALERITDAGLGDTVLRICKGPRRKLATQERLLGAARLAYRHNLPCDNLVLAFAAALLYYDDQDSQSKTMHYIIENEGIDKVLTDTCGLLPHEPLAQHIKSRWADLASGGEQSLKVVKNKKNIGFSDVQQNGSNS